MLQPFNALFTELENALTLLDRKEGGSERYRKGLVLIRAKIEKMQVRAAKILQDARQEIGYFRGVWPVFYGKLFLYTRLLSVELRRETMPASDWPTWIEDEEERVGVYFTRHRNFWFYYRDGDEAIDFQFTRAYSRSRIIDPLALVIDLERATLASHRAARCLEMDAYGQWLKEERGLLMAGAGPAADLGYSWGASDADLVEWLFGLQAIGAIQYRDQPADIARLQKWARLVLGRDIANIYDRGRVLRNRKKERVAFLKKMMAALEKKWDQAEGKMG